MSVISNVSVYLCYSSGGRTCICVFFVLDYEKTFMVLLFAPATVTPWPFVCCLIFPLVEILAAHVCVFFR